MDSRFHTVRFVAGGIFMMTGLLLLAFLLLAASVSSSQAWNETTSLPQNALARSVAESPKTAAHLGKLAVNSGKAVVHGTTHSLNLFGQALSSTTFFILQIPGKLWTAATDAAVASALTKPADHMAVPTIDSRVTSSIATAPAASPAAAPAVKPVSQTVASSSVAIWPLHGAITLGFGVPHWPYQPTHTGIDISDGRPPGVSPIHPFKAGVVVAAIHSSSGYGNHVIIDHGGGMTSLYGHMAAIAVQVGQTIDQNTVLGLEGSTGASTGSHLHFEILLNGTPVNPGLYVPGQP